MGKRGSEDLDSAECWLMVDGTGWAGTNLPLLSFLLPALTLIILLPRGCVICSIVKQELTQALYRQHIQGALTGLHQVGQPGHGL